MSMQRCWHHLFSAPKTSTWLLPLVILMSTPGSPLLVTPANAMATSHANMPPRHDPLIPAIWLWKHGTTHALSRHSSKKPLLILSYLTRAPVENVTSSVIHFILTLSFHIITDFTLGLFALYRVTSPTHYILQHCSLYLDPFLMHNTIKGHQKDPL